MTQQARSGRSTRASAAKLRTVAKVKEPNSLCLNPAIHAATGSSSKQ